MTPRTGRPRKWGEHRVDDLERYLVRLTPETKARLLALAKLREVPAYMVVEEAIVREWDDLPEEDRQRAEALIE